MLSDIFFNQKITEINCFPEDVKLKHLLVYYKNITRSVFIQIKGDLMNRF
jgi:hypothetical protein